MYKMVAGVQCGAKTEVMMETNSIHTFMIQSGTGTMKMVLMLVSMRLPGQCTQESTH